jgi:hypothetical protein
MREFNISINLTYSKIVATLVFIGAFVMDFMNDRSGTVFMFALPFVVFLITGKQYLDTKKTE